MLPATTNIFCCVFNLLEGRQKLSCALVAGGVVTNLQEVEALFVTQKRVFNTHFTKSGATKRSTERITGRLWEEKPAWPSCSYWKFKIMKTFVHVFSVTFYIHLLFWQGNPKWHYIQKVHITQQTGPRFLFEWVLHGLSYDTNLLKQWLAVV